MRRSRRIDVTAIGTDLPRVISPTQLAEVLDISPKTVYRWHAHGRLAGCGRRRGNHLLLVRDLVLDRIFNGDDWHDD